MSPRLAFAPLARYVGTIYQPCKKGGAYSIWSGTGISGGKADALEPVGPARAVSIAVGDSPKWRRKTQRWQKAGLTLDQADEICDLLRAHPTEIWGGDYLELVGQQVLLEDRGVRPEPEPGGVFCGRPLWYASTGRADYYGDPAVEQLRLWADEDGHAAIAAA